jgi:hypothetical protein
MPAITIGAIIVEFCLLIMQPGVLRWIGLLVGALCILHGAALILVSGWPGVAKPGHYRRWARDTVAFARRA